MCRNVSLSITYVPFAWYWEHDSLWQYNLLSHARLTSLKKWRRKERHTEKKNRARTTATVHYLPLSENFWLGIGPVVNEEPRGSALLQMCASLLPLQSLADLARVRSRWESTGGRSTMPTSSAPQRSCPSLWVVTLTVADEAGLSHEGVVLFHLASVTHKRLPVEESCEAVLLIAMPVRSLNHQPAHRSPFRRGAVCCLKVWPTSLASQKWPEERRRNQGTGDRRRM